MGSPSSDSDSSAGTAQYLRVHRAEVLRSYQDMLGQVAASVVASPTGLQQALDQAGGVLDDVCLTLESGLSAPVTTPTAVTQSIGVSRAAAGVHPDDSLRAAASFFDVVLSWLLRGVPDTPEGPAAFAVAAETVHHCIMRRIRLAANAYGGYLLAQVQEANSRERRRIARELHDRVGSTLATARVNHDLYDAYRGSKPGQAAEKLDTARRAMDEATESLRRIVVSLRLEAQVRSLDTALKSYVGTAGSGSTSVRIAVRGDEKWIPPDILDELFYVVREALHNALTHAGACDVVAEVDIAPDSVRAAVHDDGIGFEIKERVAGSGIAAMRERVALLSGALRITSAPGRGTSVEAVVALPHEEGYVGRG